ncbi:MAG: hypothetical protein LW835_18210 [Burkholderiaceae bacterium]|jgi:hypothetical protein|nr:hypothetical protein [Burkholderiaceae bacterium]
MAKVGRVRRDEAQWRALVARQLAGRESVARFCARERIGLGSFYRWRSRLGSDAAAVARAASGPGVPGFVDLGELRLQAQDGIAGRLSVRIDLGGGVVLVVSRG